VTARAPSCGRGIAQRGSGIPCCFGWAEHAAWVNMIRILHDDLGESATRVTVKGVRRDTID
jgi:hypothetical protein